MEAALTGHHAGAAPARRIERQRSSVAGDLYGVSGRGPNDVWAVGAGGVILHHS
jgi:uncharacterized membrane protein